MTDIRTLCVPLLASLTVLAACGQDASGEGSDTDAVATSATDSTQAAPETTSAPEQDEATMSDPPAEATQQPEVIAAVEDLAQRQDVSLSEISVARLVDVTWADGAIGCPRPGMQYSQALVPGQMLILTLERAESSAQETFAYHAGRAGTFRYCADPQPPAEEGSGDA